MLVPAIALLALSIFMAAYTSSRKGNSLQSLTFAHAVLLFVTFGFLIAGAIVLFFAAGWKWGLFGTIISYVVFLSVSARAGGVKYIDRHMIDSVNHVERIEEQHSAELESFWESTSPNECGKLMVSFLDQLRTEYPREFLQLHPDRLPSEVNDIVKDGIKRAYTVGYMCGKGLVSQKQLADITISLGDRVAAAVRLYTTGVKSDGTAFAVGFSAVAAIGHLKVTGATPEDSGESEEFLEESLLLPATFEFLVSIIPKTLQAKSPETQVTEVSQVQVLTENLRYFAEDSTKVLHAGTELLGKFEKAYNDNDFWQAIGWIRWFMVLQVYKDKFIQDSDIKQETPKRYDSVIKMLKTTADAARQKNDFDALLLAAGLCSWIGLTKWRDETLEIVRSQIGDKEVARRLSKIKRKPRMAVDKMLVDQLEPH